VLPEAAIQTLWDELLAEPGAKVTIDLAQQAVTSPMGNRYTFDVDKSVKERLMAGLDDIGVTEQFSDRINAFEAAYVAEMPWISQSAA